MSPTMPSYQQAIKSQRRFKQRLLEADFFSSLSLETQYRFFHMYLTVFSHSNPEAQEIVLIHPRFKNLPPKMRARLRYYVAVDNMMAHEFFSVGQQQLKRAILDDSQLQYRGIYFLSLLGEAVVRTVITIRRRLGYRRSEPDYSLAPHWRSEVLARTGRAE